jgi:all-trans-retinol 13,14-reductase
MPSFLYTLVRIFYLKTKFSQVYNKTTDQILDSLGLSNTKLGVILLGEMGNLGMNTYDAPFCYYAAMINHYMKGSVYPKEGTDKIIENLVSTIQSYNNDVYVSCRAQKILVESGKVVGVAL